MSDNGANESRPPTRTEILSALIGASVYSFLRRLDTCSGLIDAVARNRGTTRQLTEAARGLGAAKRKEVDQAVAKFFEMMPAVAQSTLEQMLIDAAMPLSMIEEDTNGYPARPEQMGAVGVVIGNRGLRSHLLELARRFEDDLSAIAYLNAQLFSRVEESPAEVLGSALLPHVVGAFEQFLGALLRCALTAHQESFGKLGDIPHEVFERYEDRESIRAYLIDQKVAQLLKGPPSAWQKDIKRSIKVDIAELTDDWHTIIESIQRRHVLVHNGGLVDEDYLKYAPKANELPSLGEPVSSRPAYLRNVLASYRKVAMLLAVRWAEHFQCHDPQSVLPNYIQHIVELEKLGDWTAALRLTEAVSVIQQEDADDLLRVNLWLCQKNLGGLDQQLQNEIREWQPNSDRLLAARAALLQEYSELATILRRITSTPGGAPLLRGMPIFAEALAHSGEVAVVLAARPAPQRRPAKRSRR